MLKNATREEGGARKTRQGKGARDWKGKGRRGGVQEYEGGGKRKAG